MGQTDRQTGGQADGLQHRELIILILRTMLMMLSSWQSHQEGLPGSSDDRDVNSTCKKTTVNTNSNITAKVLWQYFSITFNVIFSTVVY